MITEVHAEVAKSKNNISKISLINKMSLIYGLNGFGKSRVSNYSFNASPD